MRASFRPEIACGLGLIENAAGQIPKRGGSFLHVLTARNDLRLGDAVGDPAAAAGVKIVQNRNQAIERVGEFGLGCLARVEFVPQRTQQRRLVLREQWKNTIRRRAFALGGSGAGDGIVNERVASVDFHDVMHKQQPDDPRDVDFLARVFGKNGGHECKLPAVLSGIFAPGEPGQRRLPQDRFQLVELQNELNLAREAGLGRFGRGRGHGGAFIFSTRAQLRDSFG